MKKQEKGITLIALVITIIVLLILAGITINLTIGKGGILKRAEQAGKNYINAAEYENKQLGELLNKTDNIIENVTGGSTPSTSAIDEKVLELEAGDYIKYDSGINGVITCRVLYPVTSEYGLQIISDKNVKNVTLGVEYNYSGSTTSYNSAIEDLNGFAEDYINTDYAYDARCVGSAPTIEKGMFINKNKVKFQGTTKYVMPGPANYVTPQFTNASYIKSLEADINYETDYTQMQEEGLGTTGEDYWLASRDMYSGSSDCAFYVRFGVAEGGWYYNALCRVYSNGGTLGDSIEHGLRPCISLKSDIIKIIGGTGEDADNAYIIGK